MKDNNTFRMTYSAEQQQEVQQIREKYMPKAPDKMEQLRQLDAHVGKKATATALTIGIIGTLLLGLGMSMLMSEFGTIFGAAAVPLGIGIGIVGIVAVAIAYPLYGHILRREREKIAPEILRLTEELMQ